jgi:subfamily B ATP-binding cassette protein MsbA
LTASAPPQQATSWALYRRLLRYVRPYWRVFAVAVVGMILCAGADYTMAKLVGPLIQNFQQPEPGMMIKLPLLIAGVFLLRGAGTFVSDYGMAWVGHRVVFDLRSAMARHLLRLPTHYYDDQSAGILISRLTHDAQQIASASSSAITAVIRNGLSMLAMMVFLLQTNWRLTLILIVTMPVIAGVLRYFSRRLRRSARNVQTAIGALTHVLEEMVSGNRIVKIFGGQVYETRRVVDAANKLRHVASKQSLASAASNPLTQFIASIAVGFIIYIALGQSLDGRLTAPEFVAYVVALLSLLEKSRGLSGVNANLQRGLAAAESVFGLLDTPGENDRGTEVLGRARGELRFDEVSLRYEADARPALDNISLTIAPGETVALVGPSGGGKTSLINLLPRFYTPSAGRISIDGHDLQDVTLESLRANLAMVSQDVVLFNDTVAANIAYGGMSDASRADIERAAQAAHALDFIQAMPQGFDTLVGEAGIKLSGGQRQRIAIARAILKNAPILILDEATSALDSDAERAVQAALDSLMRNRTTIVIAHRLSTIESADRIAVLERGHLVELGTHTELLAREGLYARLYRIQFAGA